MVSTKLIPSQANNMVILQGLGESNGAHGYNRTSNSCYNHLYSSAPVTIADRGAEEAMVSIIIHNFPSHAIYGEENGWGCREKTAHFVWVLDPIDGMKSFVTDSQWKNIRGTPWIQG